MPRNRIIYANEALFVSPSPATGAMFSSGNSGVNLITQLHRVQSANNSFSIERTDINQYGQLNPLDRVILTPPTVPVDITYLSTNLNNEKALGFTVNQGITAISGILSNATDTLNLFATTSPAGQDDIGYVGQGRTVEGFGNASVTNYTAHGAVGSPATVDVSFEALNYRAYNTITGKTPAINPSNGTQISAYNFTIPTAISGFSDQVPALRPGDIEVDISNLRLIGADVTDLKVQSYDLSIDLSRETLDKLGAKFGYAKELTVPVPATLTIEAILGDSATGSLADIFCKDDKFNVDIYLRDPACEPAIGDVAVSYSFRGASLDSQSYTSSIGPNKTISLSFSTRMSGPQNTTVGVFMSGRLDS